MRGRLLRGAGSGVRHGTLGVGLATLLVPATPAHAGTLRTTAAIPRGPIVAAPVRKPGLGHVLSTADGGQIFGFDIDQSGTDGILASAQTTSSQGDMLVSMETFDQNTGKILTTFATAMGKRDSYGVDGIFTGDVALVTHYISSPHKLGARRLFQTVAPVSAGAFTGTWTPPFDTNIDILQTVEDQTSQESVLFGIELARADRPFLIVSDIAHNTFANVIHLNPALFGGADGPQLGEFTKAGKAVIALSPDAGRVGGAAPLNVLIDLKSGASHQFPGLNEGPFGSGFVNGLAVDPTTGMAATTTELNAQVEFYDLKKETGIGVQLPCTGSSSQSNSGAGIAVDALHKLFLVTDPFFCNGKSGSALVVYDERGRLVETITGFSFAIAEPAPVLNPSKRMGWAFGPGFNQLQQFFY